MAAVAGRVPLSVVRESGWSAVEQRSLGVFGLRTAGVGHLGTIFPPHSHAAAVVVRGCVGMTSQLHRYRIAMVRPGRERLTGLVEVDAAYLGGDEGRVDGRQTDTKAIVAIAVDVKQPRGFGRIRLQRVDDVSKVSWIPYIENAVQPGATVHTHGWQAYWTAPDRGYKHERTTMRAQNDPAHVVMPGVHRLTSLLKRWLLGTHQGPSDPSTSTPT